MVIFQIVIFSKASFIKLLWKKILKSVTALWISRQMCCVLYTTHLSRYLCAFCSTHVACVTSVSSVNTSHRRKWKSEKYDSNVPTHAHHSSICTDILTYIYFYQYSTLCERQRPKFTNTLSNTNSKRSLGPIFPSHTMHNLNQRKCNARRPVQQW